MNWLNAGQGEGVIALHARALRRACVDACNLIGLITMLCTDTRELTQATKANSKHPACQPAVYQHTSLSAAV